MSNTKKEELLLKLQKQNLLNKIETEKTIPVVSFRLNSKQDKAIESIAMPYVLLRSADDSMNIIKNRSQIISELIEEKLVEANFDLEVISTDYEIVYNSKIYQTICEMVAEGATKPTFLFDTVKVLEGIITPYTGCLHHEEHESCGCGHHEEHESCGCGHHEEHESCGCGHHEENNHQECNCK